MSQTDEQMLSKWGKQTKNIGNTKVIYVTDNIVDCFFNEGFYDHTRIYLNKFKKTYRFTNTKDNHSNRLHYLIKEILKDLL